MNLVIKCVSMKNGGKYSLLNEEYKIFKKQKTVFALFSLRNNESLLRPTSEKQYSLHL